MVAIQKRRGSLRRKSYHNEIPAHIYPTSKEFDSGVELAVGDSSRLPPAAAAAAAAAGGRGGAGEELVGDPRDPSCIDRKYLVAACLSCSRSSAV